MANRSKRLKQLVKVQEQLKAMHEMQRASHLAKAVAAETEAAMLVSQFNAPDSLSGLFPELYHRRISEALTTREKSHELARHEAELSATATARTNMAERAYRIAQKQDERQKSERERLDIIERKQIK